MSQQQEATIETQQNRNSVFKIQPPILDLTVDRYASFISWEEQWEDYVLLSDYQRQTDEVKAARLRYTFSAETRKIYNSLSLSSEEKKDPAIILQEIKKFAKGLVNETMERHQFNSRQQHEGETFDMYFTELKILITNCGFCAQCLDGLLRDRIVGGIRSDEVRKELLSERNLTLQKTLEKCRSAEIAEVRMESLQKEKVINRVGHKSTF